MTTTQQTVVHSKQGSCGITSVRDGQLLGNCFVGHGNFSLQCQNGRWEKLETNLSALTGSSSMISSLLAQVTMVSKQ